MVFQSSQLTQDNAYWVNSLCKVNFVTLQNFQHIIYDNIRRNKSAIEIGSVVKKELLLRVAEVEAFKPQ